MTQIIFYTYFTISFLFTYELKLLLYPLHFTKYLLPTFLIIYKFNYILFFQLYINHFLSY